MRIVFMGTPEIAVPALEMLHAEHEIALVVTQPDKPAGRGHQLLPPPVKKRALELNLHVAQPERARNDEFIAQLQRLQPDAIAVVAFGQILPRAILDLPPRGCINSHFSLLPRWRGAAPVQYAIWHGDAVTGVTTQWMAEKLDAGDVILQREIPIEPRETAGELLQRLAPIGAELLRDTLRLCAQGNAPRVPQDEAAVTLAPTIKKEMGRIDWSRPAREIANQIRAFNPWPAAWCEWRGEPLKIWSAQADDKSTFDKSTFGAPGTIEVAGANVAVATSDGVLLLEHIQPPGKPRLRASDWARGARLQRSDRFD